MNRKIKASLISICSDVLMISIKAVLASLSGSAALLADAYHSLSDLFVSISVLTGAASRSYVEKRAEACAQSQTETGTQTATEETGSEQSAATDEAQSESARKNAPGYWIEAGIAYIISLVILYLPVEIISGLADSGSYEIRNTWIAVIGVVLCIIIAYFLSRFKIQVGAETDSPALAADGYHTRMDMFSSIAVLFSLMGHQIGIRLDPLVAIIIAVLIGITGLELFITSVMGFVQKTSLRDLSLWGRINAGADRAFSYTVMRFTGRSVSLSEFNLVGRFSPHKFLTPRRLALWLFLASALWFSSGLTTIAPDEIGVKFRFGRIVDGEIRPGLAYGLPWPLEKIERVNMTKIYGVELGFRTDQKAEGSFTSTLWEATHTVDGYRKERTESVSLTGDENIVDFSLVLHYRPLNAVVPFYKVNNIDEVLRGLLESGMRRVVAVKNADQLLVEDRQAILTEIKNELSEEVKRLELGVEIMGVYCHDLHPPLEVVEAFRSVFSAREEKARLLNEAESARNASLPQARADSRRKLLEAEAFEHEQKEHSGGDAENFRLKAEAYRIAPGVTSYRYYIETAEKGMAGKKKIIADPDANRGGYNLWFFAPEKLGGISGIKGER